MISDHQEGVKRDLDQKNKECSNIFIAAGAGSFEPIKPNLECDFSHLEEKKIFYSIKDKTIFKDKKVAIFGGGDSALDWTVELQKVGAKSWFKCKTNSHRFYNLRVLRGNIGKRRYRP